MKNFQYILTHSSGNLTVEYNPVNWEDYNMIFKRSKLYHSVLRSEIIEVEFPRDGKTYIDNIYRTYGIDTDISCEIKYLDKSDYDYKTLYDGVVDLSKWLSLRDTSIVKIADSSVLSSLIARDEIEVPLNSTTNLDGGAMSPYTILDIMRVEGVDIESAAQWQDDANEIPITAVETGLWTDYRGVTAEDWDIDDIGADATLPAVVLGSASGPIYTNNSGGNQKVRYRIITRFVGNVTVTGVITTFNWQLSANAKVNGATIVLNENRSGGGDDNYDFDSSYDSGDIVVTLSAGQTIELYHTWTGDNGGGTVTPNFDIEPTRIEIYEIIDAKTESDVLMPLLHELGARTLEIITGQTDPLNAPLLGRTDSHPRTYVADGDYSLNGVASGNMLRQVQFDLKPLVTSFADYFKTIDALFNLGMWWDASNSEFVIGEKEDFYKDAKIITLGEVKDLEISIATEEYFNNINVGFADKLDYEDVNGNQNFNVKGQFSNETRRIQNTLDIQSPYHGDDYGIELARKNEDDIDSAEDSRYDDQRFMIIGQRNVSNYITLQGYDDFTVIEGVYSPETRLNLNITPKRNMLRSANLLTVPMFISEGDTFYLNKQFELDLETQKSGDPLISEIDDLAYADLEEPIYYPEIYTFTAPLENTDILQLLSDPHGYVEFDYLGVTYSGYIEQVSTQPFNRNGNWVLTKRNPNR